MRARLPWILFALSLVLNLSMIGGALYVGRDHLFGGPKNPDAFLQRVAQELALTGDQRQALEAMREEIRAERARMENLTGRWGDFAVAVLEEPTFDAEAVRWAMIERSQPWREMTLKSLAELHGFVQRLSPEQRAAFLERVANDRSFLRKLLGNAGD